ncbi:MAG: aldo/keto reductase, partial [bacterium]|nr:aldo/keto reductase [bacterium]
MKFRQLGKTDIKLSTIGLGAWAMGGGGYRFGWGEQDDKESIATIHRALDLGVNWIDTAPVYGEGRSEIIVGQAIKGKRDNVIISTKCGLSMDDAKEDLVVNLSIDSMRAELEASLKRLDVEVIDIYQLHVGWVEDDLLVEAWNLLGKFQEEGKIRCAGVSNFTLEQFKIVHPIHPVVSNQPPYNMLQRELEEDGVMDYCGQNRIGIITYSSMYRGLLTGKFTKERAENLPADDNRLLLDNYHEPYLSANLQMVEQKLAPIAQRNNKTLAQLSLAWVLRRPEVTSAIVGARTPSQIEQTAPAGDWELSNKD